mgnify:CR=1 FL=1
MKNFLEFLNESNNQINIIKNKILLTDDQKINIIKRYYINYWKRFFEYNNIKSEDFTLIDTNKDIKNKFIDYIKKVEDGDINVLDAFF